MIIKINIIENIKRIILIIICKVLYDYCILNMLPERYLGGMSHGLDYDLFKHVIGFIVFLFVSEFTFIFLDRFKENNNTLLIIILLYLYYVPLNSAYYLNNMSFAFLLMTTLFWISFVFCVANKFRFGQLSNKDIGYNFSLGNNKYLTLFFWFVCICCLIYGYKYNGLNFSAIFGDLYELRAQYAGTSSMIESIVYNFGGSLIVPLAMLYSLENRKYILLLMTIMSQIAVFSIAGAKSQFFIIMLVVIVYFVNKFKMLHKIVRFIGVGFIALLVLSMLEHYLMHSDIIFYIIVRRMMYIPAWMNTFYYEFFVNNKIIMWTQDVFLVDHLNIGRYDESILQILNHKYFSGLMPSPNAGLFAEAYMHWGLLGVVIYPLFMSFILNWIFKYLNYYSLDIQILMTFNIAIALSNLPLTSGIFCVTYLLFIPFTFIIIKLSKTIKIINKP